MSQSGGGAGRKVATLPGIANPTEMTALIKGDNAKNTFAARTTSYKISILNSLIKRQC
jgi:hypothetical protein